MLQTERNERLITIIQVRKLYKYVSALHVIPAIGLTDLLTVVAECSKIHHTPKL